MAKKAPSKHSRAARRATSPSIDLDKSLKNARPPTSSADYRPSVLGIHQSAGITKKIKKHGRKSVLSTKARRRQERGLDRAAAVLDRTAQKLQRSKSQAWTIDARSKAWDEINSRIATETGVVKKTQSTKFGVLGGDADDKDTDSGDEAVKEFYADLDEEMGEAGNTTAAVLAAGAAHETASNMDAVGPAGMPLPDEDDIL